MKMNQDMDKIKVLLVEDEQTLAMIIKDTLEEDDFILTIAANGVTSYTTNMENKILKKRLYI